MNTTHPPQTPSPSPRPGAQSSGRFKRVAAFFTFSLGVAFSACSEMPTASSTPPVSADAQATPDVPPDIHFVQANGVRFAYIEMGEGPLVLLFHGYPETARSWKAVQQKIAAAGYRVVAPYMRGYPPSGFGTDYATHTLGQDVSALIDALGAEKAVVVGHDWGAAAVYTAASSSPSKISKVVAIAFPHPRAIANSLVGVFIDAPHFVYYQFPWAERLVSENDFAHIDRLYHSWAAPGYTPSADTLADIKATLRVPGATTAALAYYRALLKDPLAISKAAKTTIAAPTLVIAGVADQPAQLSRFEQARPAFTGPYSFVKLDKVGHFPQIEAPDQTADAILSFLGTRP